MSQIPSLCPDCDLPPAYTRREFLNSTTAAAITMACTGLASRSLAIADHVVKQAPKSETLAAQLYETLTAEQKRLCALSFDHPLRQQVDNNWFITKARVGRHFNQDQQALIRGIFMELHSPEYAKSVFNQVEHDMGGPGGFGKCAVALFGDPGSGKFEFVLSGRHVTRRCDGDSVEGAAFGGPIFYGHAARGFHEPPDHPGNVYWYQAKRANELFEALDGKQRVIALRSDPREEQGMNTVKFRKKAEQFAGLPVSELTPDQKELATKVMQDVLAPFRDVDRNESMKLVEANGLDNLHFSYYKNMDIGRDGVWDVWQIEGPAVVWYFRGSPHVHAWVHIRESVPRPSPKEAS